RSLSLASGRGLRRARPRAGGRLEALVFGDVAVGAETRDDRLLRALVQPLATPPNRGEETLEIDLEGGELVVGPVLHLELHLARAAPRVVDDLVGLPLRDLHDLGLRRLAHRLRPRFREQPVDLALRLGQHLLPLLDDPAGLLDLLRSRRAALVEEVVILLAVDPHLVGERDGFGVVNEVVELVDQYQYVHWPRSVTLIAADTAVVTRRDAPAFPGARPGRALPDGVRPG